MVLSAVFCLTFTLRSQGSALYLSYQQHSDSLTRLLSNDIVGKISWVNTVGKVYFGHRLADWCTYEGKEKGLNHIIVQMEKVSIVYALHSLWENFYFLFILLKLYSFSGRFTMICPSWLWLPSNLHWPNLTAAFSPSQDISYGTGGINKLFPSFSDLFAKIDKCASIYNLICMTSTVELAKDSLSKLTFTKHQKWNLLPNPWCLLISFQDPFHTDQL